MLVWGVQVLAMAPLHRWAWNYVSLFFVRMKYYFAWKVAEGSCVLAGFGFQGYKEESDEVVGWDGVSNMDVLGFELAGNTTEAARAWNKGKEAVAVGGRRSHGRHPCPPACLTWWTAVLLLVLQARRSGCSAMCTPAAASRL